MKGEGSPCGVRVSSLYSSGGPLYNPSGLGPIKGKQAEPDTRQVGLAQ